jgi:hypothetical protein
MCGVSGCQEWPGGRATFEVRYCATHEGWEAVAWSETLHGEGEITPHGNVSRVFGPFDSWIEVGHWLSSTVRILRALPAHSKELA